MITENSNNIIIDILSNKFVTETPLQRGFREGYIAVTENAYYVRIDDKWAILGLVGEEKVINSALLHKPCKEVHQYDLF